MEITVNGEKAVIEPMLLLAYLEQIKIDPKRIAVELNLDILPKAAYGTTMLSDGDQLEIVHFVGGGCGENANLPIHEEFTQCPTHQIS